MYRHYKALFENFSVFGHKLLHYIHAVILCNDHGKKYKNLKCTLYFLCVSVGRRRTTGSLSVRRAEERKTLYVAQVTQQPPEEKSSWISQVTSIRAAMTDRASDDRICIRRRHLDRHTCCAVYKTEMLRGRKIILCVRHLGEHVRPSSRA